MCVRLSGSFAVSCSTLKLCLSGVRDYFSSLTWLKSGSSPVEPSSFLVQEADTLSDFKSSLKPSCLVKFIVQAGLSGP